MTPGPSDTSAPAEAAADEAARAAGTREVKRTPTEEVVIRFAGDSGDGIQITGSQFTSTSALFGNDIASFPDFPAEIRAPRGTLPGVSGFQLHFASHDIHTPGDDVDALVVFNPAALKANVKDLRAGGVLIVNTDDFGERELAKAGYDANPLESGDLAAYQVFAIDITILTRRALEGSGLTSKEVDRCKNFFALGMAYWLYDRSLEPTRRWIENKFKKRPDVAKANVTALQAGYAYCDATEAFHERYEVAPAPMAPGRYRHVSGSSALAMGFAAATVKSGKSLFYGSYPITPASDILHELSTLRRFGITTFQAEDEIAAVTSAIGASFAGSIGVTGTSGPGLALKMEGIGLAVMAELPLVIVCVQRGGPSTGLPTKTEQADLLHAIFGRNSDSPVAVIAPKTPGDCFFAAYEAVKMAVEHVTPVMLLSDGYLANGAEPWLIPDTDALAPITVEHPTDPATYDPYRRDEGTLARPWAIPGTPGLEHRLGGLEKADVTGNVSYDPANHEHMVRTRQDKVDRIARSLPPLEVHGDADGGDVLVVGWGSTHGAITSAVNHARKQGRSVSAVHLRWLNPLPSDLGDILGRFRHVVVPELNMGQLSLLIRANYLIDAKPLTKIQGRPFTRSEILAVLEPLAPASEARADLSGSEPVRAEERSR